MSQASRWKTCNLWQISMNPRITEFIGKPQRITNFAELCVNPVDATSDSKRLAVLEWRPHSSVLCVDLQAGGERSRTPIRLTLDESWNHPSAWTADSRAVLFTSSRTGAVLLFKQSLGQDTAQPHHHLKKGRRLGRVCLSPEGSWLFSTWCVTKHARSRWLASNKLMRVPISGRISAVGVDG